MKIATLVAVVALASGTALAAGNSYSDRDSAATTQHSSATANDKQANGGLLDRTKRALHRMGDKIRSATHRKSTNEAQAAKNDTRSMGAAGSDTQDSARQHRMDQAYADWQSKQKK